MEKVKQTIQLDMASLLDWKPAKGKVFRTEADVKKEIRCLLDQHGFFWWNVHGSAYAQSGISDIHAIRQGVYMVIEGKKFPNRPTMLQKGFLQSITAEKGLAFVVDERRLGWFAVFLQAFDAAQASAAKDETPKSEDGAAMLNAMKILQEDFVS
jgi:Holliday junction resolvase